MGRIRFACTAGRPRAAEEEKTGADGGGNIEGLREEDVGMIAHDGRMQGRY